MKQIKAILRIEEQLRKVTIQSQIQTLKIEFTSKVCSENPTAFWKQKKHVVYLPYKEDYMGTPCRSRAIPMNAEYQKLCSQEIQNLLDRGLIRKSTSPWNCYGFYVNKHSEQVRGIP